MPTQLQQPVVLVTGSDIDGPLGIVHLPRLWAISILGTAGCLADGVAADPHGFDSLVTHGLRVEPRALRHHLATLPTYVQTEAWVRAHTRRLDPATIARVNDTIRATHRNVAAWDTFHGWLVAHRSEPLAPIVPAVSSRSRGPLGVNHLARLWAKGVIDSVDALPDGFRTCRMRILRTTDAMTREVAVGGLGGLDVPFLEWFGVDVDACAAYLRTVPGYRSFEEWIVEHATQLDAERISAYNARRIDARPEKAAEERTAVGLYDSDLLWSYMLNDLTDWKTLHELATSAAR
jgi:hypothetical protein